MLRHYSFILNFELLDCITEQVKVFIEQGSFYTDFANLVLLVPRKLKDGGSGEGELIVFE